MARVQDFSIGALWATVMCAASALVQAGDHEQFQQIQPELFTAPGAVSNAWGDYDSDGDLDLVVTFKSGEVRLYRNDGGAFTNVGPQAGLPLQGPSARAAAWGDYDADGDLDLYIGTAADPIPARNYLYRNEGGTHFVERAVELGVAMPGADTRQASWIDYDGDGDLDLFVAHRSNVNRLFRNDGNSFRDVSGAAGLADVRRTVGACWFDADQDGDLDLFLANQQGDRDALYINVRGRFTDMARELRMDQPQRRLADGSVGCTVGDYDNDGDLDLFVSNYGFDLLYRNEGRGRFKEVAKRLGISDSGQHVGPSWGDYDNDGDLDLFVAGYLRTQDGTQLQDRLFRNDGAKFVAVLGRESVLNHADHGIQWADYDLDGDLDVALTDGRSNGGHWLLRNELPTERRQRSLQVTVLDTHGNSTRAGSEVRLYDRKGRLLGTRLVATGDGYNSQSVQPVHFGLTQDDSVTVEVTFMSVDGRKTQRIDDVSPRIHAGRPLVIRQADSKGR